MVRPTIIGCIPSLRARFELPFTIHSAPKYNRTMDASIKPILINKSIITYSVFI
jgi:hypothetical protein